MCEPSSLWHSVAIDLQDQPTVLRAPAQQWFRIRAAKLKSLQLMLPPEEAGFAADVLAALGNENSVKQLNVDFNGAEAQYVATFLAQLAWMRQLRALRICGLQVTTHFPQNDRRFSYVLVAKSRDVASVG